MQHYQSSDKIRKNASEKITNNVVGEVAYSKQFYSPRNNLIL